VARAQLPPEARVPQQVERRLIFLHLGRRDQGGEDDPRAAAIDAGMILVPQVRAAIPERQRRGIRIGGAGAEVRRSSVGAVGHSPVGTASVRDPVVPLGSAHREFGVRFVRQVDRQRRRRVASCPVRIASPVHPVAVVLLSKELGEVRLNGKPRLERGKRRIGGNLRGVDVQLLAPHQSRRETLPHDPLEEAAKDVETIALPDAAQTGVIRERLGQIVPEIPAQAESVGDDLQELPLETQPFEEEDELQLEEDHRVDRRPPTLGISGTD
jgi:hypothetical protein